MLYHITNVTEEQGNALMAKALPILRQRGAPTDVSTFVIDHAVVVGPKGEPLPKMGSVTFGFPAFAALRESDLQNLANVLADALGIPCYTLDAGVFAGFPPKKA